jgi:hypothetical protein
MTIVSLALSPRYASLMLEQGSYASSEMRLDFGVSLDSSRQIADLDGSALDYWSLRIRDASSSVCADDGQHGARIDPLSATASEQFRDVRRMLG